MMHQALSVSHPNMPENVIPIIPVKEMVDKLHRLNPGGVPAYRSPSMQREIVNARIRKWRARNHQRRLNQERQWRDNPRARALANIRKHNRRAIETGAGGYHSIEEWEAKKQQYAQRCAYCGRKTRLTKDHIISLFKGGSNYISNIVPACKRCNTSKARNLWNVQLGLA